MRAALVDSRTALASCERCRIQLRFCGRCDRGQRLCAECRPARRRESLRRAAAAYRIKPRSRRPQSARQARYRVRQRDQFAVQKVTHQSVTQASVPTTPSSTPVVSAGGKDDHDLAVRDVGRCSLLRRAVAALGSPTPGFRAAQGARSCAARASRSASIRAFVDDLQRNRGGDRSPLSWGKVADRHDREPARAASHRSRSAAPAIGSPSLGDTGSLPSLPAPQRVDARLGFAGSGGITLLASRCQFRGGRRAAARSDARDRRVPSQTWLPRTL
jgi:hypothetical protein